VSQITLPNVIASGDADNPTRDMANWTTIRDIINGNLDNTNINASAAIVDSKLSVPNRIKQTQRQGGSATDWNTTGTTTRDVTNPILQCGTITMTSGESGTAPYTASVTVTFPTAYTNKPIVVASQTEISATLTIGVMTGSITTTSFQITVNASAAGYVAGAVVNWIALGT